MKKYILPNKGNYYKANLHCHSTVSDGKLTPEQVKELYMSNGYSIVAYTDHDKFVTHNELTDENFLALNGAEIEILSEIPPNKFTKLCHFCIISSNDKPMEDIYEGCEKIYSTDGISSMMKKARDNGYFVTYNHPKWSMENYPVYMGYDGMHAMEIYNYNCIAEGIDERNSSEYDEMLRGGKKVFCLATDDNHNNPKYHDWFGGFTMIKSTDLAYNSICDALFAGDFYASEGPIIHDLWYEDGMVHITFDSANEAIIIKDSRAGRKVKAENGKTICEASFPIYENDGYFRIVVEATDGKRAYTNAYFISEIL